MPRPTAEVPLPASADERETVCKLAQEEDAAAERAEAKQAELRKLSKELFGSGHPPGGDSRKKDSRGMKQGTAAGRKPKLPAAVPAPVAASWETLLRALRRACLRTQALQQEAP